VAHLLEQAPQFGVHAGARRIDGHAVMARVRRERDRFVAFVEADIDRIPESQKATGHARFTNKTTLMVGDELRVEARAVVVATGSQPFVPPPFDAIRERMLTSDDIFALPALPASLAVIGTGVIALELGQAMQRLGVRVAFFNPFDELGPFTDPEVKRVVARELASELDLRLGVQVVDAAAVGGGIRLRWQEPGDAAREEVFEHVLVAAGRRPNLAGLGLESTGLLLDAKGRPRIDPLTTQCDDAPIFVAGDAEGHLPLLHEAADEGRIAGENAARYPEVAAGLRRTPLGIVFTEPQMAVVGMRYADLPVGRTVTGAVSFEDQGRSRVMLRNRGLAHVYAEVGSGRVLGAELIGPDAEHLAHLLAWGIQAGMTVERMLEMPFYHPVVEEGLRTALRDANQKLASAARKAA
jgi:dihydrolipoamide dehydrogenase